MASLCQCLREVDYQGGNGTCSLAHLTSYNVIRETNMCFNSLLPQKLQQPLVSFSFFTF